MLAHQLGHMVMHRTPTANLEEEADAFAREFLMPEAEIRPFLTNLSYPSLAGLKKHWRVSMSDILEHATHMGVINERQERRLWSKMARDGVRRRKEPPELDFPIDFPEILNELLDYHLDELGYGVEGLANLLALNSNELSQRYSLSQRPLRFVPMSEKKRIRPSEKPR
jgi:Zn-dependent peptidase ImmA (M78 family)